MLKNPNRIAAYMTALAALIGGLAPVVADLDVTSTAGIIAAVIAVTTVFREWLKGWQTMESADYQAQLMERSHIAQLEQRQAAAEVGRPGSRKSSVALPR